MSLANAQEILIGSMERLMDRKSVLGGMISPKSYSTLNLLYRAYDYALIQDGQGVTGYDEKAADIYKRIKDLMYQCPDLCIYKR